MADQARIKIAAAVTALFLAGISAAGLAAHDHRPQSAATATAASLATPTPKAAAGGSAAARGEDDGYGAEDYEELEDDE
jgi:hypothetical protein